MQHVQNVLRDSEKKGVKKGLKYSSVKREGEALCRLGGLMVAGRWQQPARDEYEDPYPLDSTLRLTHGA